MYAGWYSVCSFITDSKTLAISRVEGQDIDYSIKKIVLVTDGLANSNSSTETAFNLAKRFGASVQVVDTMRQPSGISTWFSSNASDVFEMVLADKQKRLQAIANRFMDGGIKATSKVLIGNTSESVTREAIDSNADLVIRFMKGPHSLLPGLFGSTAKNLMRICPCPVLFVNEEPVLSSNVLACINVEHDPPENEAIMRISEELAQEDGSVSGVYCWDFYGKEIMQNHVSEDSINNLQNETERIHSNLFETALKNTKLGRFKDNIHLANGRPRDVIPQWCKDQSIDIAVMCSASLNHPLQRFLGSTIESILDQLPCSLLVVKPEGFESPVQPSSATVESNP